MAILYPLSQKTMNRLRNGPKQGGTHNWLAVVAGGLKKLLPRNQSIAYLRRCCDEFVRHRQVPDREICNAVEFAYGDYGGSPNFGQKALNWPKPDSSFLGKIIHETKPCFDAGSDTGLEAQQVLPKLYGKDELICMGLDESRPLIGPLLQILGDAQSQQFIVVNPMKGDFGVNRRGMPSQRCQNNTGPRRYIVAEFDDPNLSKNNQAAVATMLRKVAPLVLAVDSGGKSIHAWYRVSHLGAKDQARFFAFACLLGADPTRWDPCGWLRMPGGLRCSKGVRSIRQRILFFDDREEYGA